MSLIQSSNVLKAPEPVSAPTLDSATEADENAERQEGGLEEAKSATPADHAEQPCKGMITIQMIRTAQISPNDYNPNQMTPEEVQEYVEEVRRLRRLPQPLVVRRGGDGYVIVDGEHGLRAAMEIGLVEVPCEVIDIDDYEAMRQTYKRNCHGTNNQVLLGRMCERMMSLRNLKQRALAKEINVSEGTIRNALLFAKAAEVRNHYAPANAVNEINALTVEQVRAYVKLPEGERDARLDAGADLTKVKVAGGQKKRTTKQIVDDAPRCEPSTKSSAVATPTATPKEASPVNDIHLVEPEPGRQESGTELALPDPSERAADERTKPEAPALSDSNEAHKAAERITAEWASASESGRLHFLRQLCSNSETVVMIKQVLKETEAPIAPTTSEEQ